MKPVCNTCNDAELVATTKAFRFGLRILNNLVKKEREYVCPSCGQRTTDDPFASDTPVEHTVDGDTRTGDVRRRQVMLDNLSADRKDFMSVQFPATYQVGQNVLWPTFEGNVQDGTVIDRHGDPDLMLEMAEQYFKLYNATMTAGRLPSSLVEVLSALHLLVTAAELGFKACLTRDGKDPAGHSLQAWSRATLHTRYFFRRSSLRRSICTDFSLDMSDSDDAEAMCSPALGNPAKTITAIGV